MPDLHLAGAIVVHNDCVLIIRRSETEKFKPLVWGVPCGKLDPDERPEAAVLRELNEETGLEGEIVRFVGYSVFYSYWRGEYVRNLQSNYLVHPKIDQSDTDPANMPYVRLPKKDQISQWVPIHEIENAVGVDEYNLRTIRQGLDADNLRRPIELRQSTSSRHA